MRTLLEVSTNTWYSNQEIYEDTQSKLDPSYDPNQDDYVAIPNGSYSESPWSVEIDDNFYVLNPLFSKFNYPDDGDPLTYPSKYSLDSTNKIVTFKVSGDYDVQMDINMNSQFYGLAQNIQVEMIRRNDDGDSVIDTFTPVTTIQSNNYTNNDINVLFNSEHSFAEGDKLIFKVTSLTETYTVSEMGGVPFVNTEMVPSLISFKQIRIAGNYTIRSV